LKDGLIALGYDKRKDNAMVYCNEYNFLFFRNAINESISIIDGSFTASHILYCLSRHQALKEVHKNNVSKYIEAFLASEYNDIGKFKRVLSSKKWMPC
jgi:hypothetical protein